jgi:ferritin
MMISDKMAARLNEQVKHEFHSYWIYLAMAFSFEEMNLKGFAGWFKGQAAEEQGHAMKIAQYLLDQGADVKLTELPQPKTEYKSAEEIVSAALEHEKKITGLINEIAELAETEKDHATREFMNWFIKEQVEEVATATDLLAMVKMAQTPGQLLMLQGHLKRD